MEPKLYSIQDLAGILGLHPKTILRFINEGKIPATKIGRAWMVTHEALSDYAHGELASRSDGGDRRADDDRDYPTEASPRMTVSATVEVRGHTADDALRLTNTMLGMLAGKDDALGNTRFESSFDPARKKTTLVFSGSPRFLAEIMKALEPLENGNEGGNR